MFEIPLLPHLAGAREAERDLALARRRHRPPDGHYERSLRTRAARALVRAGLRLDPAAGALLHPRPRPTRG